MLELLQITNDPAFARRCDALEGMRLFVDLERIGKAERQKGRDTFISAHQTEDVSRVREVLRRSRLMVRVNPLHEGTPGEVDEVLARGADLLMLPMFGSGDQIAAFCRIVGGRAPVVALLETPGALATLEQWIATPGLSEIHVGLNDLHLALGQRFMFQSLADGTVEGIARACRSRGMRFGVGGIARMNEGLLPGRDVLAEHLRLGSAAAILSRVFHRPEDGTSFEVAVDALRLAERQLSQRTAGEIESDRRRIARLICTIAQA